MKGVVVKKPVRPTDAELDILQVLWTKGPSTVRDVHETLKESRDVRYTTTLKQLQVMAEKGLVIRDETQRSHVYSAAVSEEEAQAQLLDHLLERAFAGSTSKLFLRALASAKASTDELNQVRQLLDGLDCLHERALARAKGL
jgi:BlaI family transcriptional regulator, penicillinase repressor